jgi:hypothetical protein
MSISIRDSASALTEADLAAVEQRLRVKFPDPYRAFLLRHNGGVSWPARFRISEKATEAGMDWGHVRRFYSVGGGSGPDSAEHDLERVFQNTRGGGLPERLVPIAEIDDPISGGMLCISVEGKDRGRVYYHPDLEAYDDTVYGVTKSFEAFLDRLGRRAASCPAWVAARAGWRPRRPAPVVGQRWGDDRTA